MAIRKLADRMRIREGMGGQPGGRVDPARVGPKTKWIRTAQHLVQHNPKRVDICSPVNILIPPPLLGCRIATGAQKAPHTGKVRLGELIVTNFGNPKVEDLDQLRQAAVGNQKDIVWLKITMHNFNVLSSGRSLPP